MERHARYGELDYPWASYSSGSPVIGEPGRFAAEEAARGTPKYEPAGFLGGRPAAGTDWSWLQSDWFKKLMGGVAGGAIDLAKGLGGMEEAKYNLSLLEKSMEKQNVARGWEDLVFGREQSDAARAFSNMNVETKYNAGDRGVINSGIYKDALANVAEEFGRRSVRAGENRDKQLQLRGLEDAMQQLQLGHLQAASKPDWSKVLLNLGKFAIGLF